MRTCVAQELGKEETRKPTREAACVFSDLAVASANADSMESLGVSLIATIQQSDCVIKKIRLAC